jgi:ribonuclease P/MRP protein subunit RPP1
MRFYDMLVRASPDRELTERAREMGWSGFCSVTDSDKIGKEKEFRSREIDVSRGILLEPKNVSDVPRMARKHRNFEIVCVRGGSPEMNRAVVETPEVDILTGHSHEGRSGINHVIARLARENNVMICFDFGELLSSYKKTRSWIFSTMSQTAREVNRHRAPVCITSGAQSLWEIRSPSDLLSFSRLLGISDRKAKEGMSNLVVERNRKILSGEIVGRGVELAGSVKTEA